MIFLVCGGRNFSDRKYLFEKLDMLHKKSTITEIIHGSAKGADLLAEDWAKSRQVKYTGYPAKWDKYGKKAGTIRNCKMLHENDLDGVIAFSGGIGTAHMVRIAKEDNKTVWDLR